MASSATFETKTAFSQEKYKAKKQRKRCGRVTAHPPTGGRVAIALFARSPARVVGLRWDTLALALNAADAHSGASVLVSDAAGGLATGALLERMGGAGFCCVMHPHTSAQALDAVRYFNLTPAQLNVLRRTPLLALEAAFRPPTEAAESAAAAPPVAVEADAAAPDAACEGGAEAAATMTTTSHRASRAGSSGRIVLASEQELRSCAARGGFGSLLCVQPSYSAVDLLPRLLPLLAGGAPFAIFSHAQAPLAEAAEWAIRERAAVCVELHEPWSREYQVLPSRTHPHMGMSATGGYLLIGTRVLPAAAAE